LSPGPPVVFHEMGTHASGTSHYIALLGCRIDFRLGATFQHATAALRIRGDFDPAERSRAIFGEAAKVLMHPRCMNCHPATDRILQGNDKHPHQPVATRQTPCVTCHTDRNFTLQERASYRSIPGHPRWMAAPIEMAWEGKSVGEICRQIKDPDRNGGRNLSLLHEHLAHDDLVAWGWQPGEGRDPAPGSQALLGELIQAWIDTGAQCP
jgi:hypothetical protein